MSSGTGIYMCADPDVFYTSVSLTEERFMKNTGTSDSRLSTADVKLEILALVRSLKSSILSSASFLMDKTFWGVGNTVVKQSWLKANMVAQGDGRFGP